MFVRKKENTLTTSIVDTSVCYRDSLLTSTCGTGFLHPLSPFHFIRATWISFSALPTSKSWFRCWCRRNQTRQGVSQLLMSDTSQPLSSSHPLLPLHPTFCIHHLRHTARLHATALQIVAFTSLSCIHHQVSVKSLHSLPHLKPGTNFPSCLLPTSGHLQFSYSVLASSPQICL